jgi:Cu+-exporting ATPase
METMKNEVEWNVQGMTCSNCAMTVSRFLEKKGMKNVYVDFSSGAVKFAPNGNYNPSELTKGIEGLGYHIAGGEKRKKLLPGWITSLEGKFFVSLVFTIPLLLHMVLPIHFLGQPLTQFFLCLPVVLIGISYFGKSAFGSLKNGTPNMDVLILTGSTAAFIYSFIGSFILKDPNYLFFETAAAIVTLVLLGNLIEHRSVKRTRSAVNELTRLQPQKGNADRFFRG